MNIRTNLFLFLQKIVGTHDQVGGWPARQNDESGQILVAWILWHVGIEVAEEDNTFIIWIYQ